jgi:hypothetical protein
VGRLSKVAGRFIGRVGIVETKHPTTLLA